MPIGFLKLYTSVDRKELQALRNILGFIPGNHALYRLALRHKSVANDINNKGIKNSNERLEFLGDAILGSVVAEVLFKKFPYKDEGFLTEMRSKLVNRAHLNQLSKKMGIADLINYDARYLLLNHSSYIHHLPNNYADSLRVDGHGQIKLNDIIN